MKKLIIFVLLLSVLMTVCFKKPKIKIGIMTKLEAGSLVGTSEINAAKLFLEQNKITNIEIVPIDDSWDPEKTKIAYKELKKNNIHLLITSHVSSCLNVIADSLNKDHILTIVAGATTDRISQKDDYLIRNVLDVEDEQKYIAEYISAQSAKDVLIIKDTDNKGYTDPAGKYFLKYFKNANYRVIETSISTFNVDQLRQEISKAPFDLVYLLMGGYNTISGNIAQLAYSLNPATRFVYTPWMKTPGLLETAGNTINVSVIPSHYPPKKDAPSVNDYIQKYKAKYNYAPTFISLNVYSALEIMSDAINKGNTTSDEVKKYIINKSVFQTKFGEIRFDKNGDMKNKLYFIDDLRAEF